MELERRKQFLWNLCFWAAVAAICWLALRFLVAWLMPFLLGFLIAYLLRPAGAFVCRHSDMKRKWAAMVPAMLLYLLVGAALWGLGFRLVALAGRLGDWLPGAYESSIQPWLEQLGSRVEAFSPKLGAGAGGAVSMVNEALGSVAASASEWGMHLLGALARSLPLFALTAIFTVISSVLIAVDYEAVSAFVLRQIPERVRPALLGVRDFLFGALGKMLRAYLILTAITLCELALGLWLLKVKGWLLISLAIALLDLLPVLGSGIVLVPWGIWKLAAGDYLLGGGLLALWVLLSAVRQVLEPKILGDQIGLPPLAALTAMYVGLRVAGVWGLVFAPVAFLLVRYLHDRDLVKLYR